MLTFRFISGFLFTIVLICVGTYISIGDYNKRLQIYNQSVIEHREALRGRMTYSELTPTLDRPPEVLGILCEGVGDQFGTSFRTRGAFGTMLVIRGERGNPYFAAFPRVDFAFVIAYLMSLLALIFTYDAVAGEKAQGTLKLMLANSVPKDKVLLGKYLGTLLCVCIPFLAATIISLLLTSLLAHAGIGRAEIAAVSVIILISLLLISLFAVIGLSASVLLKQEATVVVVLLIVWTFLAVISPNLILWISLAARPVTNPTNIHIGDSSGTAQALAKIQEAENRNTITLEQMVKQGQLAESLNLFNPITCYKTIASGMAGTGLETFLRYRKQAEAYHLRLRAWHLKKLELHPRRASSYSAGDLPLDLSGMPEPDMAFQEESVASRLKRNLWNIVALLSYNLLFFALAYVGFLKYDPR